MQLFQIEFLSQKSDIVFKIFFHLTIPRQVTGKLECLPLSVYEGGKSFT